MSDAVVRLESWMAAAEGERLEFKEAKSRFGFDELARYCAALSNEGGGTIVLGVTDKRPRTVVGSHAFRQPEETCRTLCNRLHLRVEFEEIPHPLGRVLAFSVPARPLGSPVKDHGVYWAREADQLVPMSESRLREVFAENGEDFSAQVCPHARFDDLDPLSIEEFRRRWIAKSGNQRLATVPRKQLLADAEALVDGQPTYAAMVLFATREALGRHLGQAEVVFEYRSSDASGPAQERVEHRQGFFAYYDDLWQIINRRNDVQPYRNGLFMLDIRTFSERAVREALLNAVSHRNYQLGGNVFVRQYPRRMEVVSPGGFPVGIDATNVLNRQCPRNRRIAEIFSKCGLVERSGQGMNLIFEESVRDSKPVPDFQGTDAYQVAITLYGTVEDPNFVQFLQRIGQEKLVSFGTHDLLVLALVNRDQRIPEEYRPHLQHLLDQGVVERVARGKFILSRRFYTFVGKRGVYTRKKGLDRQTNKSLLLRHIEDNRKDGSPLKDLLQVLPSLTREQVKTLLRELRNEGAAHPEGTTRQGRWFPGSP